MNCRRPALEGAREGDIHPLLEIRPCREILIAQLHRFTGCHRLDFVPASERGAPLLIKRGQAAVTLFQPVLHCRQGCFGKIEIPERREISDAGFIAEIVIERPVGTLRRHDTHQAISDVAEPFSVGKAGLANQGTRVEWISPITFLYFEEFPILRPIAGPPVIGRIEISCDIFDIPAHIVIEQRYDRIGRRVS